MKKSLAALLILVCLAGVARASGFTSVFGGSPVNPSDVSYAAYSFGANLALSWPQFPSAQTSTAARFMSLTATTTGLDVSLPDATLQSVGFDTIISNPGSNTFTVTDYDGDTVASIAAGQSWYILEDANSTQAGGWFIVQFGSGTSQAQASQLAGYGLLALSSTLNLNPTSNIVSTNTSLTTSSRAQLYVWAGGAGQFSLPSAASAGNGFFVAVANNGSGTLTVVPNGSDQIDGASSSSFQPTQSAFILDSGSSWTTVGKGIQNNFAVTLLNLNVAGSSNVTETSAQAQNIIQQFTGALTGNIQIILPSTVQLYFMSNQTTGPYTVSVTTSGGTPVIMPQGANSIFYCNGTNMQNAFTYVVSDSVVLNPGSAAAPTLAWTTNLNTGLYSPNTNQSGFASAGRESGQFEGSSNAVNYWRLIGSATGVPVELAAAGTDTNVSLELLPQAAGGVGVGVAPTDKFDVAGAIGLTSTASTPANGVYLSGANTLDFSTNSSKALEVSSGGAITTGVWNGTPVTVPYGGTGETGFIANGIILGNGTSALGVTATAANSALISSTTGVPAWSQTLPIAVQLNITSLGAITTGSLTLSGTTTLGSLNLNGALGLTATTGSGPANGFYLPAANNIEINTGSANAVRITSTGSTGIGTVSPDQALTVAGAIHSTTSGFEFPDSTFQTTKGITVPEQYQLAALTTGPYYTSPSGITSATNFKFTLVGGGGSGTGNGSGGSGAACVYFINGLSATTTYALTIGSGGSVGNGGNSTLQIGATTVTASGGIEGGNSGGQAGTCTNATLSLGSGPGAPGASAGFLGGGNPFGSGGSPNANGSGFGGGGGNGTTTGASGGLVIEWIQ
jgi:hypothetical protein